MSRASIHPALQGGALAPRPFTAALAAFLLLAGCGQNDTDPGPGGVTIGEAKALDEAAEMLEQERVAPKGNESSTTAARAAEAPKG